MCKNIKTLSSYLCMIVFAFLLNSCTEDANSISPKVDGIWSLDNNVSPPNENKSKGYPFDVVKVEGEGLSDVKSVVFDNLINVVFNPVLNSDNGLIFSIPFDDKKGSRFGVQRLTITKKNGQVIQNNFEILQPKPTISEKFEPSIPKVGEQVTVNGGWFINIISVSFGSTPVEFVRLNSGALTFIIPSNATAGADVTVVTPGGSASRFLDIDQGFDVIKVADFDGGGLRPLNNWVSYGAFNTFDYSAVGGTNLNYAQLTWNGNTNPTYNGTQSSAGDPFMASTVTDASKVFYLIDVNCDNAPGTIIDLLIVDSDGGNWAYTYTIATAGWKTLELKASDFGANYNSSEQTQGDVNPSKINQVKMTIAQNSGTPNPSKVQFDNIKFKVLR